METAPLDELYLEWLYSQVADPENSKSFTSYWNLAKVLYTKEFIWLVPNDDNRLEDGKDLRYEFSMTKRVEVDEVWDSLGCSMLELMVGLSRRLAFEAGGEPHFWFWRLIQNLGLSPYHDRRRLPKQDVDDVLNMVIFRNYKPNGHGGFFPLRRSRKNQRHVELWYQLSAYVLELA